MARLGIHTKVAGGTEHDHTWISYETTEDIKTYGLWSQSTTNRIRSALARKEVDDLGHDGSGTHVRLGMEDDLGLEATASSFYDLTPEQEKLFTKFLSVPIKFDFEKNNCTDFALGCMKEVLGIEINAQRVFDAGAYKTILSHADQLQNHLDVKGPGRPPRLVDPDKVKGIAIEPAVVTQEQGFFATIYNKVMGFFGSDRGSSPNLAVPVESLPAQQENMPLATLTRREPERSTDEPKDVARGRSEYQPGSHKPDPKESGRDRDDRGGRGD